MGGKTENFQYLIPPDTVARIAEILQETPAVTAYTVQLGLSGLAITERKTKVVRAIALEPQNRALDYNNLVVQGSGLAPDDRAKALIGRTLAEELQLKPGDFFTMTTTTVDGAYNFGPLQIAGIYTLNNVIAEGQLIFMPLSYGQILMDTAGVTKVIVTINTIDDTDRVAALVQRKLTEAGLELEVRTWEQLAEFYRQLRSFFGILFGFLTIEVGTIRAIGTKRYQVFLMFFMESIPFIIGAIATALSALYPAVHSARLNVVEALASK